MGCARQGTPLTVRAEGSDLVFQPAALRVAAGSMVVLTFENNPVFSHNFILVNGDEATLRAADMTGMYAHSPLLPSQTIQDFRSPCHRRGRISISARSLGISPVGSGVS